MGAVRLYSPIFVENSVSTGVSQTVSNVYVFSFVYNIIFVSGK